MRLAAIAWVALVACGCSRNEARSSVAPVVDANVVVAPSPADASVPTAPDAGVTLAGYCDSIAGWGESPEGITCRGEKVRPACEVEEKKTLATMGKVVRVHEKAFEGTHAMLALVDANGHFAILERVRTEDCDLGEPADVSLELVSASESTDAGVPRATIVFDSLRNDPPFQGGPRILTATRRSVHCQPGAGAPECDTPATLGTFTGPADSRDRPPPFSQWTKKN